MSTACALAQLGYTPFVTATSVIGIGTPETPRRSASPLRYWRIFALDFRLWWAVRGIRKGGRFLGPVVPTSHSPPLSFWNVMSAVSSLSQGAPL